MNPEMQITGERLAKSVATRADVLDVLDAKQPRLSFLNACAAVLVGGGITWLGGQVGSSTAFIIGVPAGAGFLLAANSYFECIRLRKRLDAAVILLREHDRFISIPNSGKWSGAE